MSGGLLRGRLQVALCGQQPACVSGPQESARSATAQVEEIPTTNSKGGREKTEKARNSGHDLDFYDKCPECDSNVFLDAYRAELVCSQCGVVVADTLALPGTETPSSDIRYPVESPDSRILPQLYFGPRDAMGRPVGQRLLWVLKRTAQVYNLPSDERSAVTMETRIRRLASQLALPNTVSIRAIYLFRQARSKHVVRKPGLHDFALSFLLTACRKSRYIITIEDLVSGGVTEKRQNLQRSKSNVRRYYNLIKRALNLKIRPPSIENYITYFAGKMRIVDMDIITTATRITREHMNPNSTPHCVAAGGLYIATRQVGTTISQKAFCKEANVSEISLRHWVEQLGGYRQEKMKELPQVPTDLLGPEQNGESTNGEHDTQKYGPAPAPPQETKRDDDDADDDKEHVGRTGARKKVRHRRNVSLKPLRLRRAVKDGAKAHKKPANSRHAPIKRHSKPRRL